MKRRWLVRMTLCVILGAATTVAVAWGIAWLATTPMAQSSDASLHGSRGLYRHATHRDWVFRAYSNVGWEAVYVAVAYDTEAYAELQRLPPRHYQIMAPPAWTMAASLSDLPRLKDGSRMSLDIYRTGSWVEHGLGWPAVSLASIFVWDARTNRDHAMQCLVLGSFVSRESGGMLPLRVVWPGFVINTIFYGAVWLGLFLGFTSAKRRIRTNRGRCPRCAYDLQSNLEAGCSECRWNRAEQSA